jgi:16S rRNA (guanine1516-N2)-methyltransferase
MSTKAPDDRGFVFELGAADGRCVLLARHHPQFGAIFADFGSADLRRRIAAGRRQLLARAIGLHKRLDLVVLDATGGMGRDAFTLAALGVEVELVERQPLVARLLEDAHARALRDASICLAAARLRIHHGDAREHLSRREWDVIYLDPIYPGHERDAASKKEMQVLRELSGGDADAGELLDLALRARPGRVVVKRPRSAPALDEREPTFAVSGTQARFDVYLPVAGK